MMEKRRDWSENVLSSTLKLLAEWGLEGQLKRERHSRPWESMCAGIECKTLCKLGELQESRA